MRCHRNESGPSRLDPVEAFECTEGNPVSTSSKSFDLRELVGDLVTLVKDRAMDAGQTRAAAQPGAEKIEIAILSTLAETPKNTNDIVSAIALASAGLWAPTAGKLHPILAKLTEDKKVTAKTEGDRKVYSITKAGKAALKDGVAQPTTETTAARATGTFKSPLNCDVSFLKSASIRAESEIDIYY